MKSRRLKWTDRRSHLFVLSIIASLASSAESDASFAQVAGNLPLPPGAAVIDGPIVRGKTFPAPAQGTFEPQIYNGVEANNYVMKLSGVTKDSLPFLDSTQSHANVVLTTSTVQYVRVFDNSSSAQRSWIVGSNEIRGKTPEQIRDFLALPKLPQNQVIVQVPAGTCLLVGTAGPIKNAVNNWGIGGATQEYIIGKSVPAGCGPGSLPGFLNSSAYVNIQALGPFALAYAPRAGRGNAGAVAHALDHATPPPLFSDMDRVYNALDLLNIDDGGALRGSLRQLDGEVYANVATVVMGASRMFLDVLRDQTHLAREENVQRAQNGWRSWVSGYGGASSLYGTDDVHGLAFSTGGFAVGADYRINPQLQIGVSGSYARSGFSLSGVSASGGMDSYSLASYLGYASGNLYFDGGLGYSFNPISASRAIVFPGITRSASAGFNSNALLSRAEVGYHFFWNDAFRTTPFASVQGVYLEQNGFSEQGADAINLNIHGRSYALALASIGSEASLDVPISMRAPLTITGKLGWAHDYADINRSVEADFQGAMNSGFWVNGAHWPRNAAAIGGRISLPLPQANVFIRYDGLYSTNASFSNATSGVMVNF